MRNRDYFINYADGLGYCVSYRERVIATTIDGTKIFAPAGRESTWFNTKQEAEKALEELNA